MVDTDVLIAGGGPAGLGAALALRQRGFAVMVADAGKAPMEKACGEGLMPDSLAALRSLGVAITPEEGYGFRGIRFLDEDLSFCAEFPEGLGVGMRRPELHSRMITAAQTAGAKLLWETRVTALKGSRATLDGTEVSARWIIGADGMHSSLRRMAGLEPNRSRAFRYGFRRHYAVAPWSKYMELYWGHAAQMYVTPVSPSAVCVALISRDPQLRLNEALKQFGSVSERLRGAMELTAERGATTITYRPPRITRGYVALIGDASGSVDAITGEGLCVSFQQAPLLADALVREDLAQYEAAHRRLLRKPSLMARLMLLLDGRQWLRRPVFRAMAHKPGIFEDLLAMHVGELSVRTLVASGVVLTTQMLLNP